MKMLNTERKKERDINRQTEREAKERESASSCLEEVGARRRNNNNNNNRAEEEKKSSSRERLNFWKSWKPGRKGQE